MCFSVKTYLHRKTAAKKSIVTFCNIITLNKKAPSISELIEGEGRGLDRNRTA
jgi:hypothetical protein